MDSPTDQAAIVVLLGIGLHVVRTSNYYVVTEMIWPPPFEPVATSAAAMPDPDAHRGPGRGPFP
jgi:hypothetical protein